MYVYVNDVFSHGCKIKTLHGMAEPPESWAAFLVYMSIAPLFVFELFQSTSREELPQSCFYLFGFF